MEPSVPLTSNEITASKEVPFKGSDFMGHILANISVSILASQTSDISTSLRQWALRSASIPGVRSGRSLQRLSLKVDFRKLLDHFPETHTCCPGV